MPSSHRAWLPAVNYAMSSCTWQLRLAACTTRLCLVEWRICLDHWHGMELSPALTLPWAHSANPPGRGDIGTDVESAFMRDELLTNVSIYWLSGCITSSTRLYYEAMHSGEIGRLSSTYCKARPGGAGMQHQHCVSTHATVSLGGSKVIALGVVVATMVPCLFKVGRLMLSADSYRHIYLHVHVSACC